ncbi:hypothetical protein M2352_005207 [Azospirillum fermentarium]|uniref:GNAT family N-acetyltransferase n=1 Tax=Azospirillum fermentarium TaxID=1233114 RepID=UPI002227908C|nr:GNAT family N-acetyltransferase [Azospirillum fermentarium]MCW2249524.1 hypothetical protein [Azospirillum fermentarium]
MSRFDVIRWEEGEAAWDQFVRTSPQGTVFCETRFFDSLSCTADRWAVIFEGRVVAAVPMLRDGERVVSVGSLPALYIGPMLSSEFMALPAHRLHKVLPELLEETYACLSAVYPVVTFCFHPSFPDLRGASWFNYHRPDLGLVKLNLCYTGVLDLKNDEPLDSLLKGMRDSRCYDHRRARKHGYRPVVADDVSLLDRLHRATFARQGLSRPEAHDKLIVPIARHAIEGGFGEMIVVETAEGAPAFAMLALFDDKSAYYVFGAGDPELRNFGGGTLGLITSFERMRDRGIRRFDFLGINSPQRGDYKTSFNAGVVAYISAKWERP